MYQLHFDILACSLSEISNLKIFVKQNYMYKVRLFSCMAIFMAVYVVVYCF